MIGLSTVLEIRKKSRLPQWQMLDNQAPDFGCPDKNLVALNIFYDFYLVMGFDKKLSNTCEEFKFRGWYDAAFRLGQETRQILFEFQQTR